MTYTRIGIVIADEMEFSPLVKSVKGLECQSCKINSYEAIAFKINGAELTAIKCGIGKVNAATATTMLIEKTNPQCILNIGLSGGIKGVNRGTVFAGTSFTECDFDLTAMGYKLGEKPNQSFVYKADEALLAAIPKELGVRLLKCGTGDFFITKDTMKQEYFDLFAINTFDMETGAIASVCNNYALPFMSIRKVSDDSEDSAAEDYRQMNSLAQTDLSDILLAVIKNNLT